ncbi:MAG: S-layer homology domain-containing protein, partial [Candidatus Parabeggiatoa sp.]|nr:S-layer homology domain-containing protein [Candidatus Parabeggiatoa sp.]
FVPPQVPDDEEVVIDLPGPVVGETFGHPVADYQSQVPKCKYDKKTCANKSRYHSGIDYWNSLGTKIAPASKDVVVASNAGKIVHVEKMHAGDHGMGNNVIIEHTLESAKKIYSSYSHLASIDPKIQKDKMVSKGQKIGMMGSSGYGVIDCWNRAVPKGVSWRNCGKYSPVRNNIHLHFEMKDGPVTKNPSGSGQYWGYMPSSANNYGYHDPNLYIGKVKVASGVNPSIKTLNKQSGDIQIRELNAGEGIKVTVEDKTVTTKQTAEGINLNTGIPLEDFDKPLKIIVSDNAGKALFKTYYPFSDVPPDEWYTNAIIQLWKADIINGRDSGLFGIGKPVKRAEILKMALLSGGHKGPFDPTDTSFKDVDKTHGLSGYIKYARDMSFVSDGGKNKDFRPNDPAKRNEVAKMIAKTASIFSGQAIWLDNLGVNTCPNNFTDLKPNAWYCPYIKTVYESKLMKGNSSGNQFRPGDLMKREEAAVTACRVDLYRTQGDTSPCEKEGG